MAGTVRGDPGRAGTAAARGWSAKSIISAAPRVQDLCAKPKIDIDIVLHSGAAIPRRSSGCRRRGDYIYHGDKYRGRHVGLHHRPGIAWAASLPVRAGHSATHLRRLLFRDHLRCHPEAAAASGAEAQAGLETADDWNYYTGGKALFVAEIARRAVAEWIESVVSGRDEICRAVR